ncbi:MAG: ATPase [Afipia sp.]|nr:MAG: ATPase [Afipia sp.]
MRELFEDIEDKLSPDPRVASQKSSRTPLRKRFYTSAGVSEGPDGFGVTLDGKQVRTPGKNVLAAPTRDLAEAIAAEWDAQGENIDPMSMPLTRLANSVIDGVAGNVPSVADDAAKYLETDLLFYRAGFPEALVQKQAEHWDPVLRWAADVLGAHFILGEGIVHVRQPENAVAAARNALPSEAWPIGAFHVVTTMTGSALLALALKHGLLDGSQVWAAAHVDEDWNSEKWGADEEVAARRASKFRDFEAAARVLKALG